MSYSNLVGEVVTFKLSSGEEVIGKVIEVTATTLLLSEPLSVAPNHQGMGLVPSMFTAEHDKPVTLNTNTVTMHCETADAIRMKYIEATTGIATTSKKIVLG
jgi:hypothetical protein